MAADVERLKLLKSAVEAGHRIGAISDLSDEEIRALLPEASLDNGLTTVAQMFSAIRGLDRPRLEQLLARQVLAVGPFDYCRLTIAPLLDRLGEAWAKGELPIAEEHLSTAVIKGSLLSLLRFGSDRVIGDMMVFSTLPGERHELGTLMAAVCAQDAGARVHYLGPDLPISEIAETARRSDARVVGLSAQMPATEGQAMSLDELKSSLPRGVEVWVGGRGWTDIPLPSGIRLVSSLEELRQRVLRRSFDSESESSLPIDGGSASS